MLTEWGQLSFRHLPIQERNTILLEECLVRNYGLKPKILYLNQVPAVQVQY